MYGVGTLQGHQADLELDMIDKIVDFLLWLTLLLLLLYCLHTIKVSVPCTVCGKVAIEESILCRISSGFWVNFTHHECSRWIEYDPEIIRQLKME